MQAHHLYLPTLATYSFAKFTTCRDAIYRVRSLASTSRLGYDQSRPTHVSYQLIISIWVSTTTASGRVSSIYRCTCASTLSTCWLLLLTQLTPNMAICQLSCSSTSAIATSNWLRTRAIKDLITWRFSFKEWHPGRRKVI